MEGKQSDAGGAALRRAGGAGGAGGLECSRKPATKSSSKVKPNARKT